MKLDLGRDRYSAGVEAKGGRLVDLLSRWSYTASADGRVENGVEVSPEEFRSFRSQRKRKRALNLDYDKAGNVAVTAEPPQSELSANAVALEYRPNTLDPVSAMVGVIATSDVSGCAGTFPVFDGRRRYDVIVTSNGTDTLQKSSRNRLCGEPRENARSHSGPWRVRSRDQNEEDVFARSAWTRTATACSRSLWRRSAVPLVFRWDLEWVSVG
jgi:hypothetical protein